MALVPREGVPEMQSWRCRVWGEPRCADRTRGRLDRAGIGMQSRLELSGLYRFENLIEPGFEVEIPWRSVGADGSQDFWPVNSSPCRTRTRRSRSQSLNSAKETVKLSVSVRVTWPEKVPPIPKVKFWVVAEATLVAAACRGIDCYLVPLPKRMHSSAAERAPNLVKAGSTTLISLKHQIRFLRSNFASTRAWSDRHRHRAYCRWLWSHRILRAGQRRESEYLPKRENCWWRAKEAD